jgi:hypothetical protein
MRAFARCVFALVAATVIATTLVVSEPSDLAKSQLTILKCCRYGEELDNDASTGTLPRCEPTSDEWQPLIFSLTHQTLDVVLPDEWHVVESRRPVCDDRSELTHVPYRKANPFILLDNGSAVLEISNTDSFPPSHYCADSNALLVCMPKKLAGDHPAPSMKPRVRRCCGEHASFHEHG